MKSIFTVIISSTFLFSSISQAETVADRLVSPYDVRLARSKSSSVQPAVKSVTCTAQLTPVINFNIPSRYDPEDPTASTGDPAADAAYKALVAPIQTYQTRVGKAADQYALSADANKSYADCALAHLYTWANAGALLGDLNNVGFLVTSTMVATSAAAYLKIATAYPSKTATATELAKLKVIRTWLKNQGDSLSSHYAVVAGKTGLNNQRYTSGMAIALASIATQNHDHFAAAMKSLRVGLDEINPTYGYLPLELARGARALSYHFVAVGPLVMLMEIASVNNESLTSAERAKMSKLVNFVYKSYKDPKTMLAYEPSLPTQEQGFVCNDFSFLEVNQNTVAKSSTPNATLTSFVKKQRASCGDLYTSSFGGDRRICSDMT